MLRGLLSTRHAERYASLTTSINASSCRLKNLRRAWNQPQTHEQTTRDFLSLAEGRSRLEALTPLLFLPVVAEHAGALLATTTNINWAKHYSDDLAATPSQ